jgi:hypothetical protein
VNNFLAKLSKFVKKKYQIEAKIKSIIIRKCVLQLLGARTKENEKRE